MRMLATVKDCGLRIAAGFAVLLGGCASSREGVVARHGDPAASQPARVQPVPLAVPTTVPVCGPVQGAQVLFDGQTLTGWRVLEKGAFAGHRGVYVKNGAMILETGQLQTGIGFNGEFPKDNYEVSLDAMRVAGSDFFCGMTFPVGDSPCTLIVGGWGGTVVGLSNVDDMHAAENITTTSTSFENGRWYHVRLQVTGSRIKAWIDDNQVIDLPRPDHRYTVWWEQEPAKPFGIATWDTAAALTHIMVRRLAEP